MFGDNLSMISDTTIAATQSLGCDLKDKSKSIFYCISRSSDYRNLIFYLGLNSDIVTVDLPKVGFEWIPIIPYILVIALALFGVNVFLIIGTVLAGAIGYIGGSLVLRSLSKKHMKDLLV
jgi:Na+/H+ antiporter NhaC